MNNIKLKLVTYSIICLLILCTPFASPLTQQSSPTIISASVVTPYIYQEQSIVLYDETDRNGEETPEITFANISFSQFTSNGIFINSLTLSQENLNPAYTNHTAQLILTIPTNLRELYEFEFNPKIYFTPARQFGDPIPETIEIQTSSSTFLTDLDNFQHGISWIFNGMGVFTIDITQHAFKIDDDNVYETPIQTDTQTFSFISQPSTQNIFLLTPVTTNFHFVDFSGNIELTLTTLDTMILPAATSLNIQIVDLPSGLDAIVDGTRVLISRSSSSNVTSGTFTIGALIAFSYYELNESGEFYTIKTIEEPALTTATLTFMNRSQNIGITELLIGLGILTILGGVLYGITLMTRRMQQTPERH